MPGGSRALIVGGGISGVAPLVIDNFLFLTSITPPLASTSPRLIRRATSIEVLGDGAFSTSIGNNADANGDEAIVIGRDCSQTGVGVNSDFTIIGQNVDHTGGGGQSAIIIGHDISSTGGNLVCIGAIGALGGASSFVAIGHSMTASGTNNGVIIGFGANTTGGNATAIGGSGASASTSGTAIGAAAIALGSNSIALGQACDMTGTSSGNIQIGVSCRLTNTSNVILIGHNLRTDNGVYAAGDVVIGNNNVGGGGFSSRVIWFGDTHTSGTAVPAAAMRWKNAAGTDIAAGSLTVTAPRATGNAVGGSIILQTAPAGASSAVLQTATTRLTISPNGVVTLAAPTVAAENLVIDGNGGAGQASIRLNGLTNGAGVAAGTLANAPSAGDPSFWIPISIGGLARFIPAWT